MRLNQNHPLALHLYIHAVEASTTPERADAAADRLRDLTLGLEARDFALSEVLGRGRFTNET